MMKIGFPFHSNKGTGLIEALVASAIVSISVVGIGVGVQRVSQTKVKVKNVARAIELEAALQAAIQDPNQYPATAISAMRANATDFPQMQFTPKVTLTNGTETAVTLTMGTDTYFQPNGSVCNACPNWVYQVRVEGQVTGSPPNQSYGVAYRFKFNPDVLNLRNLGVPGDLFDPARDYRWIVPVEIYRDASQQSCSHSNVIMTGMNKSTGQIRCLRVGNPNQQCGSNQVARGWIVDASGTMKMNCVTMVASGTCPTYSSGGYEYVVQTLDATKLFSATNNRGTCVFVSQTSYPATASATLSQSSNGREVQFSMCPPNFNFAGTCTVTTSGAVNGWQDLGCPSGYTGSNWSLSLAPQFPASNVSVTSTITGPQIRCTVSGERQLVGSNSNNWTGWSTRVQATGRCAFAGASTQPLN